MKRIPPLWSRCPPSPGIEMRMGGVRVEMKGEGQVSAPRRQIVDDGGCTDWLPSSSPSLSRYNHTRPDSLKPTRGLGQWVRISQSPNKGKSRPFHLTNPMTTLLSTSNSEDWAEYPTARLEPGAEHARIATELERQGAAGHGPGKPSRVEPEARGRGPSWLATGHDRAGKSSKGGRGRRRSRPGHSGYISSSDERRISTAANRR